MTFARHAETLLSDGAILRNELHTGVHEGPVVANVGPEDATHWLNTCTDLGESYMKMTGRK
jgi:hypothetical protein